MSSPRKSSKMEILENIPEELMKILFRISLVLTVLNCISVVLALVYRTQSVVAILSTTISIVIAISCYGIMRARCKKGDEL